MLVEEQEAVQDALRRPQANRSRLGAPSKRTLVYTPSVQVPSRHCKLTEASVAGVADAMSSDESRHRKIERLYRLALEQAPSQRTDFLRRACGDDESLLHAVESLFPPDELLSPAHTGDERVQTPAEGQGQSPVGRRLGPYDILGLLGRGGMGEVYRARDTRLDRIVAIKVLQQGRAQDPEWRRRFEREAQTVSSLNHPNICALHDIGRQDGTDFLVMEYVDGETLAHRIKKGPLPLDLVLRYAIQMADALSDAHRHGIVHRDFKPGNIILTKSGVKLLDFGLSKVLAATTVEETTITRTETASIKGMIVGTLAYMAPEQLEGNEVDARSDIFALGAVIYEMVTGRRAFEGKSQASLIVAITTADPPPISISGLQNVSLRALDHVVRACLAKEQDARWQSAHDVLLQLKWIAEAGSQVALPGAVAPDRAVRKLGLVRILSAAACAITVGLALGYWVRWPAPVPSRLLKFTIAPQGEFDLPVISPDGRHIAYVLHPNEQTKQIGGTAGAEASERLYIQDLDRERPREVEGSEGADLPFWSVDSKSIAFAARNHVWKADVRTGALSPICDISDEFLGGTWDLDGRSIIYSIYRQGIYQVSAGGGNPKLLVTRDQFTFGDHCDTPKLLRTPSGNRSLIYATQQKNATIHDLILHSLESGSQRLLAAAASRPAYSPTGHLIYVSLADSMQLLMAQPFSLSNMQATGDPFPIVQSGFSPLTTAVFPSVSQNGTLVYKSVEHAPVKLIWRDQQNHIVTPGPAELLSARHILANSAHMALSVDGRSLVLDAYHNRGRRELWIIDVARGTTTRLPFSLESASDPIWTPTGKEITFRSNDRGYWEIYTRSADARVEDARLLVGGPLTKKPTDWSPDGRVLLYDVEDLKTRSDLWYLRAKDDGRGYESAPLLSTPAGEYGAKFSPDGRFVAYVSDKSGRSEVYIGRFPDVQTLSRRVSVNGGNRPVWARNGRQLFFLEGDALMSIMVTTKPNLSIGETRRLFRSHYFSDVAGLGYAVSADGQRILLPEVSGTVPPPLIRVVENWFTEFSDGTRLER